MNLSFTLSLERKMNNCRKKYERNTQNLTLTRTKCREHIKLNGKTLNQHKTFEHANRKPNINSWFKLSHFIHFITNFPHYLYSEHFIRRISQLNRRIVYIKSHRWWSGVVPLETYGISISYDWIWRSTMNESVSHIKQTKWNRLLNEMKYTQDYKNKNKNKITRRMRDNNNKQTNRNIAK